MVGEPPGLAQYIVECREQKLQHQGLAKKAKFQDTAVIATVVRTRVEVDFYPQDTQCHSPRRRSPPTV